LAAGKRKVVEVELTARQEGALTVQVEAEGENGAKATLVEEIVVVRPGLKVEIEAPAMQYVKAVANYRIRVTNPGTAPARNVKVAVVIPAGARHESSLPSGGIGDDGKEVIWPVGTLAPGAEESFTLNCALNEPGAKQLTVRSAADGDLTATAEATIMVETIPDLVLDVKDPVGPVPVDSEVTYHVTIENRGSQRAEGVEVLVFFSRGIEPTSAEGVGHKIASGQIVFEKIPSLGIGEDVTLKIHAKAETAGNHIFRVEVYCRASGIRLVSEEMTHYYGGRDGTQQANSGASGVR
jgi:uncharacterized repeat protein (TIGR01451 family)